MRPTSSQRRGHQWLKPRKCRLPVCQCAERGALGYASAKYPDVAVVEVAVYAQGAAVTKPVATPCGVCRQALLEYADRFDQTMRIIAQCNDSSIYSV